MIQIWTPPGQGLLDAPSLQRKSSERKYECQSSWTAQSDCSERAAEGRGGSVCRTYAAQPTSIFCGERVRQDICQRRQILPAQQNKESATCEAKRSEVRQTQRKVSDQSKKTTAAAKAKAAAKRKKYDSRAKLHTAAPSQRTWKRKRCPSRSEKCEAVVCAEGSATAAA